MGCRVCSIEGQNDPMEIKSSEFENFFDDSSPETKILEEDRISTELKISKQIDSEVTPIYNPFTTLKNEEVKASLEGRKCRFAWNKELKHTSTVEKKTENCTLIFYSSKGRLKRLTLRPSMFLDNENQDYSKRFFIGGPDSVLRNDLDLDDSLICCKQLSIKYSHEESLYILSERKQTTGLFLKLKSRFVLDKITVISFHNYHIMISAEYGRENTGCADSDFVNRQLQSKLRVKFLMGEQMEEYVFSNRLSSVIRIGRSKNCNIVLKNEHVSRVHCR